ncbi:toll/interleukin-1 receptor domain-containing protein [Mycetocola spongiae]|uniref:toll/interleukin-1 receptor domain-containing protein n=1 Tax=Mycetocola spongiae TaxID=2859226 RepID=UPI001CF3AAE1|nr:TIR domain-containing protein [Mycetocola spongiae]UCR88703.1 TIR domain-containing protein [Mycetocola spongiae]
MTDHDFDVAVSFAGEDRAYVESVVKIVKDAGFKVFYDEDQKVEFWGEDLTEYFPDVYERRSRYVVMFISKNYAVKPWARLERRSVLARALNEKKSYLLPVRIDSTNLPGVRETIGYLDAQLEKPAEVATAICRKLGASGVVEDGARLFNGRVPRTASEHGVLLGERPPAWEYLSLAYHLFNKMELLQRQYADHRLGFAIPDVFLADEDLGETVSQQVIIPSAIADMLESLLLGPAQEEATGKPGQEGNPALIESLAERVITLYERLLNWKATMLSFAAQSDEGRMVIKAISAFADQPIEAMHRFVFDYRDLADGISPRLSQGENISLTVPLKFEVPESVSNERNRAWKAFLRNHG